MAYSDSFSCFDLFLHVHRNRIATNTPNPIRSTSNTMTIAMAIRVFCEREELVVVEIVVWPGSVGKNEYQKLNLRHNILFNKRTICRWVCSGHCMGEREREEEGGDRK